MSKTVKFEAIGDRKEAQRRITLEELRREDQLQEAREMLAEMAGEID